MNKKIIALFSLLLLFNYLFSICNVNGFRIIEDIEDNEKDVVVFRGDEVTTDSDKFGNIDMVLIRQALTVGDEGNVTEPSFGDMLSIAIQFRENINFDNLGSRIWSIYIVEDYRDVSINSIKDVQKLDYLLHVFYDSIHFSEMEYRSEIGSLRKIEMESEDTLVLETQLTDFIENIGIVSLNKDSKEIYPTTDGIDVSNDKMLNFDIGINIVSIAIIVVVLIAVVSLTVVFIRRKKKRVG
ncbi:MAG: hypothetical protein ACFFG0_20770 [Candidatus Thorarchaeota archaeon]